MNLRIKYINLNTGNIIRDTETEKHYKQFDGRKFNYSIAYDGTLSILSKGSNHLVSKRKLNEGDICGHVLYAVNDHYLINPNEIIQRLQRDECKFILQDGDIIEYMLHEEFVNPEKKTCFGIYKDGVIADCYSIRHNKNKTFTLTTKGNYFTPRGEFKEMQYSDKEWIRVIRIGTFPWSFEQGQIMSTIVSYHINQDMAKFNAEIEAGMHEPITTREEHGYTSYEKTTEPEDIDVEFELMTKLQVEAIITHFGMQGKIQVYYFNDQMKLSVLEQLDQHQFINK